MLNLHTVPAEISGLINSQLDQKDIKQLRLVCRGVKDRAKLQIPRVFISRHSAVLYIALEIVTDDEFSKQIEEIVWDNTQHCFPKNITEYEALAGWQLNTVNKELMLDGLYETREQARTQRKIMQSGIDLAILREALRLPNLKRITITSHIWASIAANEPRYDLPIFRELYDEFVIDPRPFSNYDRLLSELHGVQLNLKELAVEVTRERAYIDGNLFWELCPATLAIKAICMNSNNLTRLDLALNSTINSSNEVPCLKNGHLKELLSTLSSLEHLGLYANMETDYGMSPDDLGLLSMWNTIEDIFPTPYKVHFPKLRHLKLASLYMKTPSLIALLTNLPSLEYADLDRLELCKRTGRFHTLLLNLKQQLVDVKDGIWKTPNTRLTIQSSHCGHRIVEDDITAFFYEGGECPFDPKAYDPKSFWLMNNEYIPGDRVKYAVVKYGI